VRIIVNPLKALTLYVLLSGVYMGGMCVFFGTLILENDTPCCSVSA
jgi:hypothetical protein